MLSLKNSLKVLKKTNALLEGHFILSSGLHSAQYVQCAKLLSYPKKSEKFCKSLRGAYITKYMSEYLSCEFETCGWAKVTVGFCDEEKPAKKGRFTHTNY